LKKAIRYPLNIMNSFSKTLHYPESSPNYENNGKLSLMCFLILYTELFPHLTMIILFISDDVYKNFRSELYSKSELQG